MAPLDRPPESKPTERSSCQRDHVVIGDMKYQVSNQRRASPAVSSSSSLSYLSIARSSSLEQRGSWKPRRRHAPPPTLPIHRRAKGYDDLFPFEVSQLASVLCHAPPVNTPRDGAVWTAYVCLTNERIALLGHKLRAATTLPYFLPWSSNHGLCIIHRRLNAKPLEDIFAALRYEVEVRTREIWQPVALAGALSASQTQQLALMEELRSLWLPPFEFMKKFSRLPAPRYAYQADGCVACMLSRMGANVETAMALGAMLLGSMRRSDMLSTRVCFCREWVRYTVEGDIDCVDAALAEMEMMGTKFREARKWARQRRIATSEQLERGLGLASMPYVQPAGPSSPWGSAPRVHQAFAQIDAPSETPERQLDQRTLDGSHDHQRIATASQQNSSQQLPLRPYASAPASPESHLAEQPPPELLSTHQLPADLHSPEQYYYSAHNSPEPRQPMPGYSANRACSPEFRYQVPILQEDRQDKNILLNPSSTSEICQKTITNPTSRNPTITSPSETFTPTMVNTYPLNSPASLYSEFVTNPFLDGSSPPSPIQNRHLPPDLPFRLFERRRAHGNDGLPSPPKNAVQWPNQPPLTKQSTAEQFKDGLVPVPCLARLGKGDRSVGALWKRRAEKMVASGKR
jgi:hypothetical protein